MAPQFPNFAGFTLHLIHRAQQCAAVAIQKRSSDLDITPTQIMVLVAVSQKAGLSQKALCEATGMDRSTAADVVRRMVNKGLLHRVRKKKDARTYALTLSANGRQAANDVAPIVVGAGEALLAALPLMDRESFIDSLRTIIDHLVMAKAAALRAASQDGASDQHHVEEAAVR
jgi:DNA-binding MarR family transcriptional regulator